MSISYKKLWVLLIEEDITRAQRFENRYSDDEQA